MSFAICAYAENADIRVQVAEKRVIAGADAEESPAEREWSAMRIGNEIAGEDSWHGFNHAMFVVQDVAIEYAANPLNYVYC